MQRPVPAGEGLVVWRKLVAEYEGLELVGSGLVDTISQLTKHTTPVAEFSLLSPKGSEVAQ